MSAHILDVAQFICDEYRREKKKNIGQLNLQKYLYFSQREKIAVCGVPMFDEEMEGWKYGPVSPLVRGYFDKGDVQTATGDIDDLDKRIIYNVLHSYKGNLVSLSHKDISWINSRKGLGKDDRGNVALNIDDIREDAKKAKKFDYVWNKPFADLDETEKIYTPETVAAIRDTNVSEPVSADRLFEELGI